MWVRRVRRADFLTIENSFLPDRLRSGLMPGVSTYSAGQICGVTSLTVYSDQGWHYKMQPYGTMLARCGVTQSMSRKGDCLDNAVIESFFGTLKAEYFYLATIESIKALEAGVNDTLTTTTTSVSSSD